MAHQNLRDPWSRLSCAAYAEEAFTLQNAEQAQRTGRQQSIQLIQQRILRNACTPAFCEVVS